MDLNNMQRNDKDVSVVVLHVLTDTVCTIRVESTGTLISHEQMLTLRLWSIKKSYLSFRIQMRLICVFAAITCRFCRTSHFCVTPL